MIENIKSEGWTFLRKSQFDYVSYYDFRFTAKNGEHFGITFSLKKRVGEYAINVFIEEYLLLEAGDKKAGIEAVLQVLKEVFLALREKTKIKKEISADFQIIIGSSIGHFLNKILDVISLDSFWLEIAERYRWSGNTKKIFLDELENLKRL